MRKILIAILAALMLLSLSVFTACEAPEQPSDNEQPGNTENSGNTEDPDNTEDSGITEDPDNKEENKPEEPKVLKLRIGSYNIANGSYVSHNLETIANDILELDLDIIGFQEVDRFASRSHYLDTMKTLAELTGYEFYYFSKAIEIGGNPSVYGQEGEYGTGILSKYPIVTEETIMLDSAHYEQRVLSHVMIQVEDAEVHFFNAHLTYNTLDIRQEQMEFIEEAVWRHDYCILTGDFNIEAMEEYETIGSLTGVSNKDNPLHSYWREETPPWPTECLDNIMYSSSLILLDNGIQNDRKHSDHYLIWAEFEVD